MRTVAEIDLDLEAVRRERIKLERMHGELLDERAEALPARDAIIIRDFDEGHAVKKIAFDLDLTLNVVWHVLRRSGRTAKSRAVPINRLPAEQQRAYHKARAMGHGPGVARQMATLTKGTTEPDAVGHGA